MKYLKEDEQIIKAKLSMQLTCTLQDGLRELLQEPKIAQKNAQIVSIHVEM